MSKLSNNLKKGILAGGTLFIAAAAPVELSQILGFDVSVVSAASAAEDGAKKGSGGSKKGVHGQAGAGKGQGGSSFGSSVLKGPSPDSDSDRPPTAGVKGGKGGGGGKPAGGGTKKGDLYGDLFVVVRDPVTGAALTETLIIEGVPTVFPLVQAFDITTGALLPGVTVPRDAEGNLITTTYATGEVEFGRLSVSRSPTKVADKSLVEALSKLTAPTAVVTLDAAGRFVITVDGVAKTIDSPLENLALYKAIANLTGTDRTFSITATSKDGSAPVTYTYTIPATVNIDMLKASLLAAAADKAGIVTLDTVMYLNPIVGVTDNLTQVTYDRQATYDGKMVTVLIKQPDGVTYVATLVNLYDVVFQNVNDTTSTGAADFATAVNDALQVLEYIHDNEVR